MKLTIYHSDRAPSVSDGERVRIEVGVDGFDRDDERMGFELELVLASGLGGDFIFGRRDQG